MFRFFNIASIFLFIGCRSLSPSHSKEYEVILDNQHLKLVPTSILENTSIKTLSLFNNQLDSLPSQLENFNNLEVLYLGKNDFKHFPSVIFKLKNLRILSLAYNELDSIPSEISQLENLEMLLLNNNQIFFLSDSIGQLKNLSILNLSRNQLTNISSEIGACTQLRTLQLNYNNLEFLPVSIGNLSQLKELEVYRAGALLQLPESICNLRYLEFLKVDQMVVVPMCLLTQKTNRLHIQGVE
jgi:leucine-rich repeat protein SHOC2